MATLFSRETELSVEIFYRVLKFICIETTKIYNDKGVIPIWEQKRRKNKISAQPILLRKNRIIYSPITLYILRENWTQGIMNFILPYNIGLKETTKSVDIWKKHYEDKIVRDLSALFSEEIYEVYINKELYKLDKKGKHPRNLGDYDLIVINKRERSSVI